MPATAKEERWATVVRDLIWRYYKALKTYKQNPTPASAPAFRRRFDRIFTLRTGYEALDKLLERLHRRKNELLKVLDYPDIPLHTNASESALRTIVRISLNRDSGFSKSRTSVSLSRGQRMRSNPGCLVAVTRDCVRLFRRRSRASAFFVCACCRLRE
ncbi:transposase (plasmid) [Rhizobium rhododendri]|uniref:Transposase n=1 Tax=Rhizobium rhododendri TaxID=2506430 RepID=A0ABY8IRB1_9HYPH|nr:transposase [Rhizobium rhododendri]WFS26109.1 transposase [Rhizobium rhododendri]